MAPANEQVDTEDDVLKVIKDTAVSKVEKAKSSNGASGHGASSSSTLSRTGSSRSSTPKGDSNANMAMTRAEVSKGPVWLETLDGDIEEVEREVALLSPLVQREVMRFGHGASRESPVVLPKQVSPGVLKLILDYCRFHRVSGRSDKERKIFDEKFIRLDTRRLCELTSAADSLDMKPLVDLTSRALARMIEGKTPEEIRETFHLPDDLTEEEKLEPVKNATDDPRIRLLNRLYARKRKELQEKKLLKSASTGSDDKPRDDRSVDDLLSFIDGNRNDGKTGKTGKAKKKKKNKKKDHPEDHSEDYVPGSGEDAGAKEDESGEKENQEMAESLEGQQSTSSAADKSISGEFTQVHYHTGNEDRDFHPVVIGSRRQKEIFDDTEFDDDDGIDPAMREKLDREVEDFARRLNVDWEDRKEEILALASSRDHEIRADGGGYNLSVSSAVSESSDMGTAYGDGTGRPWDIHEEEEDASQQKDSKNYLHQRSQSCDSSGPEGILEEDSLGGDDFSDHLARALVEDLPNWTPRDSIISPIDSGRKEHRTPSLHFSPPPGGELILAQALAGRRDELGEVLEAGVLSKEREKGSLWTNGNINNGLWDVGHMNSHANLSGLGGVADVSSICYDNGVGMLSPSIASQSVQTGMARPGSSGSENSSNLGCGAGSGVMNGNWRVESVNGNNSCTPPLIEGSVVSLIGGGSAGGTVGGLRNTWSEEAPGSELLHGHSSLDDGDWGTTLDLRNNGTAWESSETAALDPAEVAGFLQSLIQILHLESQVEIVLKGKLLQVDSSIGPLGPSFIQPQLTVPRLPLDPRLHEGGTEVSHRLSSGGVISVALTEFEHYRFGHSLGIASLQESLAPRSIPNSLQRLRKADVERVVKPR